MNIAFIFVQKAESLPALAAAFYDLPEGQVLSIMGTYDLPPLVSRGCDRALALIFDGTQVSASALWSVALGVDQMDDEPYTYMATRPLPDAPDYITEEAYLSRNLVILQKVHLRGVIKTVVVGSNTVPSTPLTLEEYKLVSCTGTELYPNMFAMPNE